MKSIKRSQKFQGIQFNFIINASDRIDNDGDKDFELNIGIDGDINQDDVIYFSYNGSEISTLRYQVLVNDISDVRYEMSGENDIDLSENIANYILEQCDFNMFY